MTNISKIQVIVDDREKSSATFQELNTIPLVDVQVKRLPLGDYQVDGNLLFERKTLIDLIASIKDGRLFKQACKLASSPIRPAIILEGTSKDLSDSRMRREAIQGAMISISIVLGIPLLRSRDGKESARLMLYAAEQIRTAAFGAVARKGKRPKGKRRMQLYFLQGLPRVGPERSQNLLEKFGSIEAVITAEQDELINVPGIGTNLAKKIRWLVTADR